MSHTTTWTNESVVWVVEGVLTSSEILEFLDEMAESRKFDQIDYFIWDTTRVIEMVDDVDDPELSAVFSSSLSIYNKRLIGVLLVNDAVVEFAEGYLSAMEGTGSAWILSLQRNMDDAKKWIEAKRDAKADNIG